jgi:alpha-maltose-1-phosphate synthase
VNGHPPTLKHGHTGLIVAPGDAAALRDAILELSGNARLRRCMGRTARLEAESLHAWEHTVERLEQVFLAAHAGPVH